MTSAQAISPTTTAIAAMPHQTKKFVFVEDGTFDWSTSRLLQAYAYKAFTATRIPQAFCTVYHTGLQGSQISAFRNFERPTKNGTHDNGLGSSWRVSPRSDPQPVHPFAPCCDTSMDKRFRARGGA